MTKPPHRLRIRLIRRRVVAGAVATFIGTFGVIFVEVATGHDPALHSTSHSSTSTSSGSTKSSTSSSSPTPVTTSQS